MPNEGGRYRVWPESGSAFSSSPSAENTSSLRSGDRVFGGPFSMDWVVGLTRTPCFSDNLGFSLYRVRFYRAVFGCAGGKHPTLGSLSELEPSVACPHAFSCRDRVDFCSGQ